MELPAFIGCEFDPLSHTRKLYFDDFWDDSLSQNGTIVNGKGYRQQAGLASFSQAGCFQPTIR
jgi:hypothetical protein